MAHTSEQYTPIPLDDDAKHEVQARRQRLFQGPKDTLVALVIIFISVCSFSLGFVVGKSRFVEEALETTESLNMEVGKSFVPKIPNKSVKFQFPTRFEDTGPVGDGLWNSLMPDGAGFIRVPHPRRFRLPPSEPIKDDEEEGEVYSLSVTHQLHCLAVVRDVIIKYEKGDKSRFAGAGHEHHCIDYIRQAILCAGDTTLDFADDRVIGQGGKVSRYGFTGSNSTHQCRDWDAIKAFAEKHKSGDRSGVL